MSTELIFSYVNRCVTRSKFVKFFNYGGLRQPLAHIPYLLGLTIIKIRMGMFTYMNFVLFVPLTC